MYQWSLPVDWLRRDVGQWITSDNATQSIGDTRSERSGEKKRAIDACEQCPSQTEASNSKILEGLGSSAGHTTNMVRNMREGKNVYCILERLAKIEWVSGESMWQTTWLLAYIRIEKPHDRDYIHLKWFSIDTTTSKFPSHLHVGSK